MKWEFEIKRKQDVKTQGKETLDPTVHELEIELKDPSALLRSLYSLTSTIEEKGIPMYKEGSNKLLEDTVSRIVNTFRMLSRVSWKIHKKRERERVCSYYNFVLIRQRLSSKDKKSLFFNDFNGFDIFTCEGQLCTTSKKKSNKERGRWKKGGCRAYI